MKYFTITQRSDGLGAQLQTILFTLFYCEKNNLEFVYNQINSMEHNYDNDPNFIKKVDELINIKDNYKIYQTLDDKDNTKIFGVWEIISLVQSDINNFINHNTTEKYRNFFWKNKNKNHFNNDKINIAIHIRRQNQEDNRVEGSRTPDEYYIDIINNIRKKYNNNNLQFHIYSQGNINNFECFKSEDTILHINEDLFSSFIGLVAANILVTSASSFSYSAAFITEGIVYYLPFWHPPLNNWIICNNSFY